MVEEFVYYRPQQSCEGYVFTPVWHSVRGGVCLSTCWDATPPHPRSRHPPDQALPGNRHPPPPQAETATAADGTHSTGMHSCLGYCFSQKWVNLLRINCIQTDFWTVCRWRNPIFLTSPMLLALIPICNHGMTGIRAMQMLSLGRW